MKRYPPSDRTQPAFTLVEVVTAIAIIAILAAILVPAFNLAFRTATNVKQKAQFNSINIALEGFRTDFGDYPESTGANAGMYCGAQRLAEAVIGYDGFGFHPKSVFAEDGTIPNPAGTGQIDIYLPAVTGTDREKSLRARKGPYLELETANGIKLIDLYGSGETGALPENTYVLTDAYGMVTHRLTKKRVGMPILYYKADVTAFEHDWRLVYTPDNTGSRRNIINLRDNFPILNLPVPFDLTKEHPLRYQGNESEFYQAIGNPNYTNPARPFRSESFILHSAGGDGLYGTPDDVFNFDPGK